MFFLLSWSLYLCISKMGLLIGANMLHMLNGAINRSKNVKASTEFWCTKLNIVQRQYKVLQDIALGFTSRQPYNWVGDFPCCIQIKQHS
jgi:hypothetical protein